MAVEATGAALEGNEGVDALHDLEARITRAVNTISDLRHDNESLRVKLHESESLLGRLTTQHDEAHALSEEFQKENSQLAERVRTLSTEIESLRGERKQVKSRIEKLLGQLDQLGAS